MSPQPNNSTPATPRAVLTSLIDTLTSAPLPPSSTSPTNADNPLQGLPQSHRPLLLTLHVIFPSIVLPALDLLDRNLVTRVLLDKTTVSDSDSLIPAIDPADLHHRQSQQQPSGDDKDAGDRGVEDMTAGSSRREPAAFHLVRSVASTMSRHNKAAGAAMASATTTYLVQLDAWNCTCANFAFEAFPATGQAHDLEVLSANSVEDSHEVKPHEWQFGGSSLDGIDYGGVPCCKHLLASLLSEQWRDVLGSYVAERRVNREEMAGLVADV
nr:ubiquitin carboxyl-terminal hydrolase family protein [Colletotrichum truncatum]KAF6793575.1 ubiquitin carboxyl-terminal hydrolase family protein [Colletotrichum truncatum]